MKALIQRVRHAYVEVDGKKVGEIGQGLLVLLGVDMNDQGSAAEKLADRVVGYRIFADDQGKMNLGLKDIDGDILVVSQFTLSADTRKGRRPGFSSAAQPEQAKALYEQFVERCTTHLSRVETGVFAADMQVGLVNDGPVTFLLEAE